MRDLDRIYYGTHFLFANLINCLILSLSNGSIPGFKSADSVTANSNSKPKP